MIEYRETSDPIGSFSSGFGEDPAKTGETPISKELDSCLTRRDAVSEAPLVIDIYRLHARNWIMPQNFGSAFFEKLSLLNHN